MRIHVTVLCIVYVVTLAAVSFVFYCLGFLSAMDTM